MKIEIVEITKNDLELYSKIPMEFTVSSVLQTKLINNGLGGITFEEREVDPYIKDFRKDESPLEWIDEFDTKNWGFFIAYLDKKPVGGITLVYDTPNVNMLSGRDDLTVLWDIRVGPKAKGLGVGRKLFKHAVNWARERGCSQIKIESQNNNVPACKFYVNMGCKLGDISTYAYYKDEIEDIMLVWYYEIEGKKKV